MFAGTDAFNQLIGGRNIQRHEYGRHVHRATAFNQDLTGWDTSNVHLCPQMFHYATAFNGDISGWNTANVTKYRMKCSALLRPSIRTSAAGTQAV